MSKKHKIAVIGANSMVGSRFCELSKFDLVKADLKGRVSVDITSKISVKKFFKNYKFDILILLSAFTDVDAAEKQREDKSGSCWQINVIGVRNIIIECKNSETLLIFISTDFVFDGTSGPYSEDSKTGPDISKVSWYGVTKMEAEKLIRRLLKEYIILRIAYPYRAKFKGKDDIAKRILRLYQQGNLHPMFYDQKITPTFIDDIAPGIELLVAQNQIGTFHLASPKETAQFEFAKELLSVFRKDPARLKKSSVVEFLKDKNRTPRPVNGGLKVEKIEKLGFKLTNWKKGIKTIYSQSKGQLI